MSKTAQQNKRLASSFRDPSGFLFTRDDQLYRQVNRHYQVDYEQLISSGLYQRLVDEHLLIPHTEAAVDPAEPEIAYKILQPETVPFISYPYEWSFNQLKDAALATLAIQKHSLSHGMSLKDASAYNIQFHKGRPVLIDSLSFEAYRTGQPWVAYRQFCQHFLAPLALMAYRDVRLSQLTRVYIDGVPLDLASTLLPFRTRFSPSLFMHIHAHASAQKRFAGQTDAKSTQRQMSKNAFIGIIDSLTSTVKKLQWRPQGTEWVDYYSATNYSDTAEAAKGALVERYLEQIKPELVWDLGANTGKFSRLASHKGIQTMAFDIDPGAVERSYLLTKEGDETRILPLVLDLTNPSSSLGWHHHERDSLLERGPADAVMALALIHHLAIANNVPLGNLASFFHEAGKWLIIEFVPKGDSQVDRLLATREDIFPNYTLAGFEQAFSPYFTIHAAEPIADSDRVLYLLERSAA